jgi:hypothetical protein
MANPFYPVIKPGQLEQEYKNRPRAIFDLTSQGNKDPRALEELMATMGLQRTGAHQYSNPNFNPYAQQSPQAQQQPQQQSAVYPQYLSPQQKQLQESQQANPFTATQHPLTQEQVKNQFQAMNTPTQTLEQTMASQQPQKDPYHDELERAMKYAPQTIYDKNEGKYVYNTKRLEYAKNLSDIKAGTDKGAFEKSKYIDELKQQGIINQQKAEELKGKIQEAEIKAKGEVDAWGAKASSKTDTKTQQGQQSLERYSANLDQLNELMGSLPEINNIGDQAFAHANLLTKPNQTTPEISAFEAQKTHVMLTAMKAIEDTTGRPSKFMQAEMKAVLPKWDDPPAVKQAKMEQFQNQVKTSMDVNYQGNDYQSPYGTSNAQQTNAQQGQLNEGQTGMWKGKKVVVRGGQWQLQ